MFRRASVFLFFLLGVVFPSAVIRTGAASTNQLEIAAIKETIEAYFEHRYYAHQTLQLESFESLIGETAEAQAFLQVESGKLMFEIQHLKHSQLRYIDHNFFLDYLDVLMDGTGNLAVVSLLEGHDVVFEISEKSGLLNPPLSKMRNLHHLITLRKEKGIWKIITDQYEDY